MNLSQLEVLVAIVETGSLTEAAEQVGLTQSAVSHSLNRLEAELGVTLLERGRSGIAISRIGEDVLQHARTMLTQAEIIRQKTARERGLSVGKIRFGAVTSVAPTLLTGIIRDFQHRYPNIEIVLFEGNPYELMEWLSTDVIDVATVLNPQDYALSTPLAHDEIKLIVSEKHPLANEQAVDMALLSEETMIGPRSTYQVIRQLPMFKDLPLPRLRYEVSAYGTIFSMVQENMGVSITPSRLVAHHKEGIVSVSLIPPIYANIYLAAGKDSPANAAFLDHAHEWVIENGYLAQGDAEEH